MSPWNKYNKSSNFSRKRNFNRQKYRSKPSNIHENYNRSRFNETCDFPRRYDTYPLGFYPQSLRNSMSRPQLEIMNPNYDLSRNYNTVFPQFQNPSLDIPRRYNPFVSWDHNPRYDGVFPEYQNPSFDYLYRKTEVDSFRFHERRIEISKEDLIVRMNQTRDFSRKYDVGSSRSQVRTSENPKESFAYGTRRRERSWKLRPVSPRFRKRSWKKRKGRSFAKTKQVHGSSRNYEEASFKESKGNSREDPMVKTGPIRKRKRGGYYTRDDVTTREQSKDGMAEKVNPSNDSSRESADYSLQVQVNACDVPNEANPVEGLVTSVSDSDPIKAMVACDDLKVQKNGKFCLFPKHGEVNCKGDPIVKTNKACEDTKLCDANSPRIVAITIEKSKEDPLEKVDQRDHSLTKCVGVSPSVQAPTEIIKAAKPLEAIVTNDDNHEPTNSAMPHNNFKIRKVKVNREFPKHCGALAPYVTIWRNVENSKWEVINDNIKSLETELVVVDMNEGVVEVTDDGMDKVSNETILPKDLQKAANHQPVFPDDSENVANDPVMLNDIEKSNRPVYHPCSSLFEEHNEQTCSEDEGNLVDATDFKLDLLPTDDKISAVDVDSETVFKRKQVKETIDKYELLLVKLLEDNKAAQSAGKKKVSLQIHTEAAMLLKRDKKWVNTEKVLGHVPGIEVGDKFRFRAELVCIGLHRMFQSGIDYLKTQDGKLLATSVVHSGRYANDGQSSDVLIYCGQGGNPALLRHKRPQDQKLEKGNLALKNSMEAKAPVRVIRKTTQSIYTYYYDGLYVVTKVTQERSVYGKMVYMFHLNRIISGNPNITQVEKLPFLIDDISLGKEKIPIPVVNTVDDEQFPMFNYITKMTYPESCYSNIFGCDCIDCYSDSKKCRCSIKNGGEAIFDDKGAIIVKPKSKRFIYECGPSCKCPSLCKNRVSQYGIRCQLEVFRTKSMGWGVRSPDYIPAGSFICEYVGELLQEDEVEQRIGNDEYLFEIDNNGFTIDAAKNGNVGRFINHSCSPNLYAQNVLYDHGNKRMSHVMFFAVNGIFPFQELTYDYNYKLDQVLDSDGNIKRKACHCGSRVCTGRLY